MPFAYDAYLPDEIAQLDPLLPSTVAVALQAADDAVRALNETTPALTGLEALSRQLLRQESVASSRIEGLVMSQRRLAKAAVAGERQHRDTSAEAIVANIRAMEHAINVTATLEQIDAAAIVEIHRVLLEDTRDSSIAGIVRDSQNWIGGNAYNPHGAEFVPPPEGDVPRLLDDLATFLNRTDLSPTLQAAIGHAQFETIHPFGDGNGRVGRALIHVVYRRRGTATRLVPPVSLVLATEGKAYIAGLTAYRSGQPEDWHATFADTVARSVGEAQRLERELEELEGRWLAQSGNPRAGSATRKLIAALPGQPVLRIQHVIEATGASESAAHRAVDQLVGSGVLKQITIGDRNRAWEASALLDLIDAFERDLATPRQGGRRRAAPR
jgi:Fic family protein